MIIFLYGQDSYRLIQYVDQLIERYQKKYPDSFNFHKFDAEEGNLEETENAIKGVSFFKQVKFVVIKNPFSAAGQIEKIIKENPSTSSGQAKDTVLLLYEAQSGQALKKKNDKFFNFIAKISQVKEFKPLTTQMARKFTNDYLLKNKISLEKKLLDKLIQEVGQDSWRLKNEIEKIVNFARAVHKTKIDESDLTQLVQFKIDSNIFNLLDSAFSNKAKALILFEDYFSQGGDPIYLLNMLAYQLKNMLVVRELMDKNLQYRLILAKTKMHPFVFRKVYELSKKYNLDELKEIFGKLADFEIAVKTGRAEPENIFFKIFIA